ncbi:MAG: hypothetical protein KA750_10995, partial [Thermoflexales bacterium]|nr:hypothetical protein [Thermoflexales bacterium]
MATTEERLKILKMIEEGKISADDGAKLLAALSAGPRPTGAAPSGAPAGNAARFLRVRVTDSVTGKAKVNINLPIGLVNVGMKIGARFAPEMSEMDAAAIVEAIRSNAMG